MLWERLETKHRWRGEKKNREKGENKIKCSEREIGEWGVKREEAQDRLSDKYVRYMLQFTAPPPAHDHSFWDASRGYCFLLFWLCQENYRHEAPALLAITSYIFSPHACKKKRKKETTVTAREKYSKAGWGNLLKWTRSIHMSWSLFVKLTPSLFQSLIFGQVWWINRRNILRYYTKKDLKCEYVFNTCVFACKQTIALTY